METDRLKNCWSQTYDYFASSFTHSWIFLECGIIKGKTQYLFTADIKDNAVQINEKSLNYIYFKYASTDIHADKAHQKNEMRIFFSAACS